MATFLEVTYPSGSTESHPVVGDQVIVGQSAGAAISLPAAVGLEPEHLMLSPRRDGVWVSVVKDARIPAVVRGETFQQGQLAFGTEIAIGPLKLRLSDTAPATAKGKAVSVPMLAAMIVGIPLVAWLFLSDSTDDLPATTKATPPELVAAVPDCRGQASEVAVKAREAAQAAGAKSDRYPFAPHDGVQAIELYHLAIQCYTTAGMAADAQRIKVEADALEQKVHQDYKTHVLRLERMLKNRRLPSALAESQALLALLGERDDPYTAWVRLLEQRLRLRVESTKKGS